MTDNMQALEPCPFCGVLPRSVDLSDDAFGQVVCENPDCLMQPASDAGTYVEAVAAWNRRAQPTPATVEARCPDCDGRGVIETGEMEKGIGGYGFVTHDCQTCQTTGAVVAEEEISLLPYERKLRHQREAYPRAKALLARHFEDAGYPARAVNITGEGPQEWFVPIALKAMVAFSYSATLPTSLQKAQGGGASVTVVKPAGGGTGTGVVIPPGMKPWAGAYGPPRDVDHDQPTLLRDGRLKDTPVTGNQWLHVASHAEADIIAYTPKKSAPLPAPEVVVGTGERVGEELKVSVEEGANSHFFDQQIIVNGECVAFASAPWSYAIAAALSTPAKHIAADHTVDVTGLREALEPFKDFADFLESETMGVPDNADLELWLSGSVVFNFDAGQFRRARAALAGDV